ncbi:hypothetical protein KUCAC02_011036 [Chaenocephalus aceratus]|uniref:Uncharacterized protein n=1 Tax=Chaenocephalus aceratus TaxID=36190 RepID=A0ACB9WUI0_CHAAC|nr:hypothetical protein KUCAC02_011036 [Chaenocephalus aceratus]
MGSEKDSESPHSSVSGIPNPKCRAAGKRHGRISFHSLFHSKRGARGPKGAAATPYPIYTKHHHTQQPLLPSALSSAPPCSLCYSHNDPRHHDPPRTLPPARPQNPFPSSSRP